MEKKKLNINDYAHKDGVLFRKPIGRRKVLQQVVKECLEELYWRAQPQLDINAWMEDVRSGKIDIEADEWKKHPLYTRHYISKAEYDYVLDKYITSYGLEETWKNDVDIVLRDLEAGAPYEAYEDDPYWPGKTVRTTKHHVPLAEEIGQEVYDIVKDRIQSIRNWYRFDREESDFRMTIALGVSSPSTSKKQVEEFRHNIAGEKDFKIADRDEWLFWCIDEGYETEDLEEEYEEHLRILEEQEAEKQEEKIEA